MDELDRALRRAWTVALEDLPDETDAELGALVALLVAAGYVAIDGESPTGYFWRFTSEGVRRVDTLGLDGARAMNRGRRLRGHSQSSSSRLSKELAELAGTVQQ